MIEEDARVVALRRIWLLNSSIGELADLPLGWQASPHNTARPVAEKSAQRVIKARPAIVRALRANQPYTDPLSA